MLITIFMMIEMKDLIVFKSFYLVEDYIFLDSFTFFLRFSIRN